MVIGVGSEKTAIMEKEKKRIEVRDFMVMIEGGTAGMGFMVATTKG